MGHASVFDAVRNYSTRREAEAVQTQMNDNTGLSSQPQAHTGYMGQRMMMPY